MADLYPRLPSGRGKRFRAPWLLVLPLIMIDPGSVFGAAGAKKAVTPSEYTFNGFVEEGAKDHADKHLGAKKIQHYLDRLYARLATGQPTLVNGHKITARKADGKLVITAEDLHWITAKVQSMYKEAGIDATAYHRKDPIDKDGRLHVHVHEKLNASTIIRNIVNATPFHKESGQSSGSGAEKSGGFIAHGQPGDVQAEAAPLKSASHSADSQATQGKVSFTGFVVDGVSDHPDTAISQDNIQQYLDQMFKALLAGSTVKLESGDEIQAEAAGKRVVLENDDVRAIVHSIKQKYDDAHLIAVAYIHKDAFDSEGRLRIHVLESRFGKVIVTGNKHTDTSVIQAYFSDLPGSPADPRRAEDDALRAQELPGLLLKGSLQPGQNVGETDLVVQVVDERRFQASVGADDYGTNSTGLYRVNTALQFNDLTGLGDQTDLAFTKLFDPTGSIVSNISENIPLIDGVNFFASWNHNTLQVSQLFLGLAQLKGFSDKETLGLNLRFVRSASFDQDMRIYADHVRSRVDLSVPAAHDLDVNIVDDTVSTINFEMSLRYLNTDGLFGHGRGKFQDNATFTVRHALGDELGDEKATSLATNSSLDGQVGVYYLYKVAFAHIQSTFDNQALILAFHGQYSNDFLPTVDEFSMGGPDSVRAYPVSEVLRDSGYAAQFEYRVNAPFFASAPAPFFKNYTWGQLLAVKAFFDYAYADDSHSRPVNSQEGHVELHGPGFGFGLNLPRTGPYFGGAVADFTLAYPTSKTIPSDESSKKPRVYASLNFNF